MLSRYGGGRVDVCMGGMLMNFVGLLNKVVAVGLDHRKRRPSILCLWCSPQNANRM